MSESNSIVLHFDINKSIIASDRAKELNTVRTVQKLVCEYVWGYVKGRQEGANPCSLEFECKSKAFTLDKPDDDEIENKDDLRTFTHYLQLKYPDPPHSLDPGAFKLQQHSVFSERQAERAKMFTDKKSSTYKLKNGFDKIMKNLSLNKTAREVLKARSNVQKDADKGTVAPQEFSVPEADEQLRTLYEQQDDVRCFILPSFLKLLASLKKQKRNFALVFRTFGEDYESLKLEFNRFCNGTHPLYSGMNGTTQVLFDGSEVKGKVSKIYDISDENTAQVYRFEDEVFMVFEKTRKTFENAAQLEQYFENSKTKWLKGHHQIQVYLNGLAELKNSCLFLRDDYHFWGEREGRGKLFYVDEFNRNCTHIMFDDNIVKKAIVDCRDPVDFEAPKPWAAFLGSYLVNVDTVRAINESDYFIKRLEECEAAIAERHNSATQERDKLDRIEEAKDKAKEDLKDPKKTPNSEYLKKTVLPLLGLALEQVDFYRPQDPLNFIALYMIKNKNLIVDEELE